MPAKQYRQIEAADYDRKRAHLAPGGRQNPLGRIGVGSGHDAQTGGRPSALAYVEGTDFGSHFHVRRARKLRLFPKCVYAWYYAWDRRQNERSDYEKPPRRRVRVLLDQRRLGRRLR